MRIPINARCHQSRSYRPRRGPCLVRLALGRPQARGSNFAGRPTECPTATSSRRCQSLLPMGLAPPTRTGPLGYIRFTATPHPSGEESNFFRTDELFQNHLCPGLKSAVLMLRAASPQGSTVRVVPGAMSCNSLRPICDSPPDIRRAAVSKAGDERIQDCGAAVRTTGRLARRTRPGPDRSSASRISLPRSRPQTSAVQTD